MEDFKKIRKNYRKDQIKSWFTEQKRNVEAFLHNNKETIITLVPIVIGVGTYVIKTGVKQHQINKAERIKNMYCYDRSLGHYWKLRRELSNSEWVEIDKRKKSGERLADILESLKVLA